MEPTKISAKYYLKVVDCQQACPAHTDVPEYIRLIAEQKYSEAYLVNRRSNVFPGILGRVCDRPCEPACRRKRVEDKPVAICRLKRVAADLKEDIQDHLPQPGISNGKTIVLVGAGPASLTVINALLPYGYQFILFEKEEKPGGAMLSQVPSFRLPQKVLDEEIGYILNHKSVKTHFGNTISDLSPFIQDPSISALFIGTGAPLGKDLSIPGREEAKENIHIGVDFLANVAFGHLDKMPSEVCIIGGGNTAMDCCRTARRLGAKKITLVTPETFDQMLASPWEKEETLEEGVDFINNLLPKQFKLQEQSLSGVEFSQLTSLLDKDGNWSPKSNGRTQTVPCQAVVIAIGQKPIYPFIQDHHNIAFSKNLPHLNSKSLQSSNPKVFFGGDASYGPKNIISAVAEGHKAAESIHLYCQNKDPAEHAPFEMELTSQKMAMNQWSFTNDYSLTDRQSVDSIPLEERFASLNLEVETGFKKESFLQEASRCLNCDIQTVFQAPSCIECDACTDICPVECLTMVENAEEPILRQRLKSKSEDLQQSLMVDPLTQTNRVMVKDENLCLHCGLCAERCPTGAWDMQKFKLQLKFPEEQPL